MAEAADEEYTRIYWNAEIGAWADECLDTVMYWLQHDALPEDEVDNLPLMIAPYTEAFKGPAAIPLIGCLDDIEKARLWAGQFGRLDANYDPVQKRWTVFVDGPNGITDIVHHPKEMNAVLMAGVQVLRQHAYAVLAAIKPGERPN